MRSILPGSHHLYRIVCVYNPPQLIIVTQSWYEKTEENGMTRIG